MSVPQRECTATRPRRMPGSSMMSSCTSVAVWMNSTTDAYSTAAFAAIAAHARRHQQHRRADPLAAAGLEVLPDLRDELHARLHVLQELLVDARQVVAHGLEDLG